MKKVECGIKNLNTQTEKQKPKALEKTATMQENTPRHFLKLFTDADRAEFSRLDRRKNWLQTTVGQRIRYSRYKKEISQTELAHICGLSQSAITNVELDKKDSLYLLEIAIALRVKLYTKVKTNGHGCGPHNT